MLFQTIPDFLQHTAAQFPDKVGLVFNGRRYCYQDIEQRAAAVCDAIDNYTDPHTVVALLLPNSPEFIFAYFGILKAGRIVLLLPANISDEGLAYQIEKTGSRCILTNKRYESKIERAGLAEAINCIDIEQIQSRGERQGCLEISPDDISTIIFTSGTTGLPKGVQLKHRNVASATRNIIEFLNFREDDIDVNISSLSHSFGLGHIHCVFAVGGTSYLFRDTINLRAILETIVSARATTFGAVPAILRLLTQHYKKELSACDKHLRFVQTNTSPLEHSLVEEVLTCLPTTDFNYYYGLSEASRSTFITLNKHADKRDSVGLPSPHVEIKIVDDQGRQVSTGDLGEICIKGDHVIDAYWKDENASARIRDGWLYTGDVGFVDDEGYLFFKGRKDSIINISGEKVSPEEIEEVAKEVPGIVDAGAVGVPDPVFGEKVKLFVCTNSPDVDSKKVIRHCRVKLEAYKVPREVKVVGQIPRTENGKVRRNALKNM